MQMQLLQCHQGIRGCCADILDAARAVSASGRVILWHSPLLEASIKEAKSQLAKQLMNSKIVEILDFTCRLLAFNSPTSLYERQSPVDIHAKGMLCVSHDPRTKDIG